MQLIAAVAAVDLLAVLVGGVLASVGALLVQRSRDRNGARAAARLIYGELRDNRRQLHALQGVLSSQYALLFDHGLDPNIRQEIAEAGFDGIDDVEYYLAHLDDFALAAADAGYEDLLDATHERFRDRLTEHGILPGETLRRNAWRSHSPGLVAHLEPEALAAISTAYELVDRVRVTTELGEPGLLEGDFFRDEVVPGLEAAMAHLALAATLDRGVVEADAASAEAEAWAAMQDVRPDEKPE